MTDAISTKHAIERAIALVESDTSKISADVRGSTVILDGEIVDPGARDLVIASVLEVGAVECVIDSLHVSGGNKSIQAYMKQGDGLARMMKSYFGDELTWDEYKGAKKRTKPSQE